MSHHYLRFDDVRYTYPDGHEALRGVSFTLRHGEKAALVGMNGAGNRPCCSTPTGCCCHRAVASTWAA